MPKKKKWIFGGTHTGYVSSDSLLNAVSLEEEEVGSVGEPTPKPKPAEPQETPEEARVRELKDEVQEEMARREAERRMAAAEMFEQQPPDVEGKSLWETKLEAAGSGRGSASGGGRASDSAGSADGSTGSFRAVDPNAAYRGRYAQIGTLPQAQPAETKREAPARRSAPREYSPHDVTVRQREPVAATEYDDLVNWKARLAHMAPLFSRAFSLCSAHTVLEAGSGGGQRTVMFAEWGLDAIGVEADPAKVEKSRQLAERHHLSIAESGGHARFSTLDFESFSDVVGGNGVDAIVCADDILSTCRDIEQLRALLAEFADLLVPGGVIVLDLLNNTHYIQQKIRSTTPEVYDTVEGTKVFFRVMDYPAGSEFFSHDASVLTRDEQGVWSVQSSRSRHLFISSAGITRELFNAGFDIQEISGDYTGSELQQYRDEHIVVIARRKRHRTI